MGWTGTPLVAMFDVDMACGRRQHRLTCGPEVSATEREREGGVYALLGHGVCWAEREGSDGEAQLGRMNERKEMGHARERRS